jgi:hypothetical protein
LGLLPTINKLLFQTLGFLTDSKKKVAGKQATNGNYEGGNDDLDLSYLSR